MRFDKLSINLIWSVLHQFSYQIISLIVTIIFSRILLPYDVGLMAMTAVFYMIGERLSEAGLGSSLVRAKNVTEKDYNTVFFTNVLLSLGFYAILFFIAPFVATFYNQPILTNLIRINSLSIVILAFGSVQMTILVKELQFKKLGIISVISTIIGSAIGIGFAIKGYGVWSLVVNLLCGQMIRNIILWTTSSWKPKLEFCKEKFNYHFNFGYKIALANIIDAVFTSIYIAIIGKRFTPTLVGFYSRADSIKSVLISSVFGPLLRVLYPYFSEKQDQEDLDTLLRKAIHIIFALTTPLLLIMCVLAKPIFFSLFTTKWADSAPIFQLICFAAILFPLESFNEEILKIKSRSDLILKSEVYKKSIIVIAIIFAFRFSIYILLYTQILLSFATFAVNAFYTKKVFKISIFEQLKIIIPILFVSGITAFTVYLVNLQTTGLYSIFRVIVGFSIGIIVYYYLCDLFNIEAMKLIKQIIVDKFKKKEPEEIELLDVTSIVNDSKLSIIIPVYNVEKYLIRCFNSVVKNNTFKNFEIIFVNDGSTDNSLQIINEIQQNNKNVEIKIFSQENQGLAATRNFGVRNSTGDYIFFLDSDDYIDNQKILKLLHQSIIDDLDVIGFKFICINDDLEIQDQTIVHKLEYYTIMLGEDAVVTGFQPTSACVFLYRKNFLIENNLFCIPKLYMEDVEFTLRVMLNAKRVLFTKEEAYYYYFSNESIKRTKSIEKIHKYLNDQIEVSNHIKNFIQNQPHIKEQTKKSITILSNKGAFSLLYVMLIQNPTIKPRFVKQCFKRMRVYKLYPLNNHLDSSFQRLLKPIFNNKKVYLFLFRIFKKMQK